MNNIIPAMALATIPALVAPAIAESPAVFPTPKQTAFEGGSTKVEKVTLIMRGTEPESPMWSKLPTTPGGYALEITEGALTVWANDADGAYYAKQTLSQLLQGVADSTNAQADPFPELDLAGVAQLGKLPLGTLIDWPDIAERGVVEGYYGTPWSMAARKSLFRFYGRNKMNIYIYGPKDDLFHHGKGCYLPYPKKKAEEIAELAQAARDNHVRFVWAIHPANTVRWDVEGGKPQLDKLCEKMESLYALGVRDFGVFVDDSFGEILKPERQAQLCNYILENFIRKHPEDVTQHLIMVPTGYNKSWTDKKFLNTLGQQLDPTTRVMWTGDTVVNDITLKGQRWVHEHLGRPTYIWWNWPCNDFKRGRLSMGRTYGLGTEPEMQQEMTGFTANPMEQAEANKIGLFGVADYTWNITGFRSEVAWRTGIERLYPELPWGIQLFCDHNAYLLPNGHHYYREESVSLHETAAKFIDSLNIWQPDTELARKMQLEYRRIATAGDMLMNLGTASESDTHLPHYYHSDCSIELQALRAEIKPWLKAFTYMGTAGEAIVESMLAQDTTRRFRHFFRAAQHMYDMSMVTRMDWNNGHPKPLYDVEVGTYIMTPALRDAFSYSNARIYGELSGHKPTFLRPTFTTNGGDPGPGAEKIGDGKVTTFWESGCMQEQGHWYCLDFGEVVPVMNVSLLMSTTGRPNDYAAAGQMEYTVDGKTWKPVGEETRGANVVFDLQVSPLSARMVRYRITEPRKNRMAIAEFAVNSSLPAVASSTIPAFAGVSSFRDEKQYGINRVMEVHKAQPGETIELLFPEPVQGSWLEVNLGNKDIDKWAKIELTLADGRVVEVHPVLEDTVYYATGNRLTEEPIVSMKLTHVGDKEEEVSLFTFKLDVPSVNPALNPKSLTDMNLSTAVDCTNGLERTFALPEGTNHIIVVGSASCIIDGKLGGSDSRSRLVQHFFVPRGTKRVTITAPAQEGKLVHEVIFRADDY